MSDCCNTTAWVDVTLKSGKPLSFCYHHFAQHELALAGAIGEAHRIVALAGNEGLGKSGRRSEGGECGGDGNGFHQRFSRGSKRVFSYGLED